MSRTSDAVDVKQVERPVFRSYAIRLRPRKHGWNIGVEWCSSSSSSSSSSSKNGSSRQRMWWRKHNNSNIISNSDAPHRWLISDYRHVKRSALSERRGRESNAYRRYRGKLPTCSVLEPTQPPTPDGCEMNEICLITPILKITHLYNLHSQNLRCNGFEIEQRWNVS